MLLPRLCLFSGLFRLTLVTGTPSVPGVSSNQTSFSRSAGPFGCAPAVLHDVHLMVRNASSGSRLPQNVACRDYLLNCPRLEVVQEALDHEQADRGGNRQLRWRSSWTR
jgi:hypothetical protein